MALRTVTRSTAGSIVYSSKMTAGDKVEGFFMGIKDGTTKNPKWKAPRVLIMQTEDGRTQELYPAGNLNYIENNAEKDPSQKLAVGQYTVITKTGSYVNKQGRDFPTFSIQQDDSRTVQATASAPAAAAVVESTMADRLNRARQTTTA